MRILDIRTLLKQSVGSVLVSDPNLTTSFVDWQKNFNIYLEFLQCTLSCCLCLASGEIFGVTDSNLNGLGCYQNLLEV